MRIASPRVKRLSAALAVLLAAIPAAWLSSRAGRAVPEVRLLEAEAAGVSRVEIRDRGISILLEREGPGWVLLDGTLRLPARSTRVEALLAELRTRRRLEEAGRTGAASARLGLAEGAGLILLLDGSGNPVLELRIGDFAVDGASLYVARGGDPRSWSTDRAFASFLDTDRGRWLELGLGGTFARAEDATAIVVRGSLTLDYASGERFEEDYRLYRDEEGTWRIDGGRETALDQGRVDALVRMLLGLEADDIAGAADPDSFVPDLSISLLVGGSPREWRIREVSGGFEIEAAAAPWRYRAGAARLRSVLTGPEALLER
ncbi:MAG: DUF4340 domain-containing protein [Spirochaetia bacterium]|nr:DUF4340 domain-containing protein [Spirochaetia bacterium]